MSLERSEKIALAVATFVAALGIADVMTESRFMHLVFLSALVIAFAIGSGHAAFSALRSGVARGGKVGMRAERKYHPVGFWSLVLLQSSAFLACVYGIIRLVPLWIVR
jgi:hypothetical protein